MSAVNALTEAAKSVNSAAEKMERANNHSVSGVHFHGSSGLTLVGVAAVVVAVAAVCIVAAWRSADLREIEWLRNELASTRDDLKGARAMLSVQDRRITLLESKQNVQ